MSNSPPTIAIFGATGGVANAVLVNALRAGHNAIALVRTPSKLTTQLKAQGLTDADLSTHLTIIPGNALNPQDVKKTLSTSPSHLVTHIISGLGAAPVFTFSWRIMTIDNPTLCGDAAKTLLTALSELYTENPTFKTQKPHLTFVSTTGISPGVKDVPFGLQTLYHYALAVPHQDKKNMESAFTGCMNGDDVPFKSVVGVKPTLLTGSANADEGVGLEKVRAGGESEPATGYSVCRADVGKWIYVNVVEDEDVRKRWEGELVSLTS